MANTLRQKVYEEIKRKIVFIELKPGEKLSDKQIATELGIGRTPVREALLILSREKLVQCNGKQGYFVKKLTKDEADGYFAIRTALELFAAPSMIKGATPSVLKALDENIKRSERCGNKGDLRSVIHYHNEFDETLYKSTNSEVFIETISSLVDKLHWLRAIALRATGGLRESSDDHKRILRALEKKNVKELKRAIETHLRHAKEKYVAMAEIIF
jgi:DNA-binding GntR family transcriptional regulator